MGQPKRPRGVYTKSQLRGVELARRDEITYEGDSVWSVNDGKHVCLVNLDRDESTCAEYRHSRPHVACAHHWAVLYTIDPPTVDEFQTGVQPSQPDNSKITRDATNEEDLKRTFAELIRGGYTRHAKAYDESLRSELLEAVLFAQILFGEVARGVQWREIHARGRRQTPLSNILLSNFLRSQSNWSYRRTEGFMRLLAHERIHLIGPDFPCFDLASRFNRSPVATPVLRNILAMTAEPFRDFGALRLAADGTGIGSSHFSDYRCEKRDGLPEARRARWFRAHVICDVDSLHAVCVRVTPANGSEKLMMLEMLQDLTDRGYTEHVEEILADGGYSASQIRDEIAALRARPVVPWNRNAKSAISKRYATRVRHPRIIKDMFHLFSCEPERFKEYYRMRVKVEGLFSAVKGRFGGYVRSLDDAAPENEILWKFICHNIHMLLMAARVYDMDHELLRIGVGAA